MSDDDFNLDDPGSEGGSEASLDDFFQPTGGKGDGGGSGEGVAIDDFFAPPADTPKAKPAQAAKPASDLPIDKSKLGDFPEEPEAAEPMETMEPGPPPEDPELSPIDAADAEKKSFLARAWIFLVLFLVLILAGGASFMAYTKFFAPKKEIAVATPAPKPKPKHKPKPKPSVAPAPDSGAATDASGAPPATSPGATVVKPVTAPDTTAKPAAGGGTEIETEEEGTPAEPKPAPIEPAPKPGKPGKPGKPATTAPVVTEPEPAPIEPAPKPGKPGKPGKPAPIAAEPPQPAPKPAPVVTPKPAAKPAPVAVPKPAPAPPKPVAVATAKPGKPAPVPPKPAPAVPPKPTTKPAVRPAPPKPVAQAPRPAAVPVGGPWYVQIGSYMLESSKTQPEQQLHELGFTQFHYTPETRRLTIHHVLVGKNLSPDESRQVTAKLQGMGYATEPGPGGSVKAYSYGNISIARTTRAKLVKAGFKQVTIKSETKTVTLDQLRVGGYASRAQAGKAQADLRRGGFRGALVIKE